ncbi:MAG: hypothetical protein KGO94_00645 [Alphaproteobacteria bacterium]|nr:hypothetical protein [Alphaproteobacteria bacterium]
MTKTPAPIRQMPVTKAFSHIVSGIAHHWQKALGVALPWLLLSTLLNVWSFKTHPPSTNPMADFNLNWTDWAIVTISLIAQASVAVSWNQFVFQDKPMNLAAAFRVDKPVWLYLGRVIFIALLCTVPLVAIIISGAVLPRIFFPVIGGLFVQLIVFAHRMMISLPGLAIGDTQTTVKHTMELTRGNNLRILGLVAMVYAMILVVFMLFLSLVGTLNAASPNLGLVASFILGIPVLFLHLMLTTNMLTSLYGYFVQGRDF